MWKTPQSTRAKNGIFLGLFRGDIIIYIIVIYFLCEIPIHSFFYVEMWECGNLFIVLFFILLSSKIYHLLRYAYFLLPLLFVCVCSCIIVGILSCLSRNHPVITSGGYRVVAE